MSWSVTELWLAAALCICGLMVPAYLSYRIIFLYQSKPITKMVYVFLVLTPILGIAFYFFYVTEKHTIRR
jgi:hypothetical protein